MNRRNFIESATLLSAGAMAHQSLNAPSVTALSKFKLGYQLFSIRDMMAKDPVGTLKDLKEMGYEDFEIYGYDISKNSIYGYQPTELMKVLDDLRLTVTSGHYGFADFLDKPMDDMRRFVDGCISCAKALQSNYITWPWMAPEQRTLDTFKKLPALLNQIGKQCNDAGLGFAYHNHGFEFDNHDGAYGYDILLRETDSGLVKFQMDMYWVMHAGITTPKQLVQENPDRFTMWHIKDMDPVTRDYSELGNGSINYLNVLPDPATSGLEHYYIEQGGNFAQDSTRSAADSAAYFKKYLKDKL